MQDIIVEKPYEFIDPLRGNLFPTLIQTFRLCDRYLAKYEGVVSHEVRGVERLKESLRQRCGILLAPNHCRYADPLALGWLAREAKVHVFAMASWHLFQQSRFQAFAMRAMGGFSVFREGLDRKSLETAIEILVSAKRPLIVFPEGTVFRTNDLLQPMLDGVAFLARSAARRRFKAEAGRIVIHPIAIKYVFKGDLQRAVEPVLQSIERRLTWESAPSPCLLERIERIGEALLSLKEIEFIGKSQLGSIHERQLRLIDHLLNPLERKWLGAEQPQKLIGRIKQLRTTIVPELIRGKSAPQRRAEIWHDLADIYLAQQLGSYPPDYLRLPTTETRVLETVERLDEDLNDYARIHSPLHAIIDVGEAIDVDVQKSPREGDDPLMIKLRDTLQFMLDQLAPLGKIYNPGRHNQGA